MLTDGTVLNVITWLQRQNLIASPLRCVPCNRGMELAERNPNPVDGYPYQRGRRAGDKVWVFGVISSEHRVLLPGSEVHTDDWAAYSNLHLYVPNVTMHREGIIGSDGVRLLTFSPLSPLSFAVYFLSLLRNDTRRVRWPLATATRLHRIRWNPFAHIFLSLLNSTLLYIFKYLAN
ncbi:hypothetical protein pdam_00015100 [Pocillopora damicornis]|uniref:ISXO2-like transposase domain-containing protein n=1 Tax=Pocillopora damicornis TaxID=46731 RepID=A0A3M6UMI2_POCDA|nr:hypothetical protein pdam_00015100 [Pocillopora damicornis]